MDPAALAQEMGRRLALVGIAANGIGGCVVALFFFLSPVEVADADYDTMVTGGLIAFAIYMPFSLFAGRWLSRRRVFYPLEAWLLSGRPAGPEEQRRILRIPLTFALGAAVLWVLAAVLFSAITSVGGPGPAVATAVTVLLGGLTACALQYLLVERAIRPATARALAGGAPPERVSPGVATRLIMAWVLATGVPLLGIAAFAVAELAGAGIDEGELVETALFLAGIALAVGLAAMLLTARSISDPLAAMREAVRRVGRGELGSKVEVDDGSEVGLLEAGFNRMAEGLEERERLRDLFGRHVGREVAAAALDREIELGGEEREVAALFVDLVGSTRLASERPATEVVSLLNDFFRIVVEATEAHGGLVNKFEGDAALCVFGAPVARNDPAGEALAAAREMRDRLRAEVSGVDLGIGVSAGIAVAGNVGAEERYEYTVIGDPINEAARLCELAKQRPERVLASAATLERAGREEAERWSLGESVTLRGRSAQTRLATTG
jgi:adenylate cyclase